MDLATAYNTLAQIAGSGIVASLAATDKMAYPLTYGEALARGADRGRTAWERGYVSRRADPLKARVQLSRDGTPYVLLASWRSSRYCVRQYLTAVPA